MPPEPQILLSLPPSGVKAFRQDSRFPFPQWHADCDPVGCRLGSGGGSAWLLFSAWKRQCQIKPIPFWNWLGQSSRIIIHAGGESRRLPAYAPGGKAMLPMPALRWSHGQHLEQTLLDVQLPFLTSVLRQRQDEPCLVIACGDVILRGDLPPFPDADIVALGMWTTPEQASRHGVFFCPRERADQLAFALQKPSPDKVKELSEDNFFLIDTGCWVLSRPAVQTMMQQCGWDIMRDAFRDGGPTFYDLYTDFGQRLGNCPAISDPIVSSLSAATVPLKNGGFHHVGASRELISSTATLQNLKVEQYQDIGRYPLHPSVFIQNAVVESPLRSHHQNIWIENCHLGPQWQLSCDHVITGIPENNWRLALPAGVCLDLVPISENDLAVRVYGIDDPFRGSVSAADTLWLGQPAQNWFTQRGLSLAECGIPETIDLQQAALFPVLERSQLDSGFLQWLCGAPLAELPDAPDEACLNIPAVHVPAAPLPATAAQSAPDYAAFYRSCRRVSATELGDQANLARLAAQRRQFISLCLPLLYVGATRSIFLRLDLRRTAELWNEAGLALPATKAISEHNLFAAARETMFRSEVLKRQGDKDGAAEEEHAAFALLCEALAEPVRADGVVPQRRLLEDQVLWTRSPVRLDLAGGWTDTPPQCFFAGGKVLNIAAEINGQPPLQCFLKLSPKNELIIRSIDLGCEERIEHYEQLRNYMAVGSPFSIPKAAFALCGFLPEFHASPPPTLADLLKSLGGGLEMTMLSALPKGSGLGTSSILAATILGALNEVCGFGWTTQEIIRRTSVLEQLLTTGGGWQDQAGGIIPGVKMLETRAGLFQTPQPSWLPERMFVEHANRDLLLYYTGITRVAKSILHEVVRGMFLNDHRQLAILAEMGAHAQNLARQIQRGVWDDIGLGIHRSWELNCALDPGTNPPAVRKIFTTVKRHLLGAKLLGAGGGGYMLMAAKSEDAAAKIRQILTDNPPNKRARFVSFTVSTTGMQVTRS
ncbi:MAG TPA: L-fucokinase [Lentisphaeria bacterium]|nr:MAG: D-glycero-alpha-D-manno-heptose 7-phosphate kinase [Lentisphaerae bacterium ADurb.Bin082]HQC51673.1 L-fucokinase [Lentisphaeria bacterium]HQL87366.1 L-fucokinase [Lentisphaeria bacterium]